MLLLPKRDAVGAAVLASVHGEREHPVQSGGAEDMPERVRRRKLESIGQKAAGGGGKQDHGCPFGGHVQHPDVGREEKRKHDRRRELCCGRKCEGWEACAM